MFSRWWTDSQLGDTLLSAMNEILWVPQMAERDAKLYPEVQKGCLGETRFVPNPNFILECACLKAKKFGLTKE